MLKKILLTLIILAACPQFSRACTSAIIGADATRDGRPLLWKHRDTSTIDNKVEYVPSKNGSYAYVALFNAADKRLSEAWTGMNSVGFAIMNTASYNIKDDNVPEKEMDKEGYIMSLALANCRTVDDFAHLLDTLPRPMGVEANFGVIDASGDGAFFETNNHSYVRYNLSDAPGHVLIRANYSHSGRENEGYGYVREANAEKLLEPYISSRSVTPELLTETLSRSFYHDLKQKDFAKSGDRWVADVDFIPRYKSTATIVIEGCRPGEYDPETVQPGALKDEYIMWTGLGYPPCAEIVPVWCSPDGVVDDLRGIGENGHSPMCDKVKARRDEVFCYPKGQKSTYIDMSKLVNNRGTGYLQILPKQNHEIYEKFRNRR